MNVDRECRTPHISKFLVTRTYRDYNTIIEWLPQAANNKNTLPLFHPYFLTHFDKVRIFNIIPCLNFSKRGIIFLG
jgi:hypothetical protein